MPGVRLCKITVVPSGAINETTNSAVLAWRISTATMISVSFLIVLPKLTSTGSERALTPSFGIAAGLAKVRVNVLS